VCALVCMVYFFKERSRVSTAKRMPCPALTAHLPPHHLIATYTPGGAAAGEGPLTKGQYHWHVAAADAVVPFGARMADTGADPS
jgi:hypothetical protein